MTPYAHTFGSRIFQPQKMVLVFTNLMKVNILLFPVFIILCMFGSTLVWGKIGFRDIYRIGFYVFRYG